MSFYNFSTLDYNLQHFLKYANVYIIGHWEPVLKLADITENDASFFPYTFHILVINFVKTVDKKICLTNVPFEGLYRIKTYMG
jgi:hypothetical protein